MRTKAVWIWSRFGDLLAPNPNGHFPLDLHFTPADALQFPFLTLLRNNKSHEACLGQKITNDFL